MAVGQPDSLPNVLQSCFPDAWLRQTGRACGVVTRQRKVDIADLFWCLVLGFAGGACRTLAQLHRAYELASGVTISRSSFYERFTPQLVVFLKTVALHGIAMVAEPEKALGGKLDGFRELIVADSTVLRLRDALEKWFPACRTNHTKAAMKLHMVMSVAGASPKSIQLLGERRSDSLLLRVGKWVKGRLLLMDLGYFGYRLFQRIARNGGFFVSRLKDNANPLIVACNIEHRGRARKVVGLHLRDVLHTLKRQTLDVMIEVSVRHRAYLGVRRTVTQRLRLVAVFNPDAGKYHIYVTNVPCDDLTASDVAAVYRARWQVELLFKELKTNYRIDDLPSENRLIVEALIYAAILTLLVSRSVLRSLQASAGLRAHRTPPLRWGHVFSFIAPVLLCIARREDSRAALLRDVRQLLLGQAMDPNVSRRLTMRGLAP